MSVKPPSRLIAARVPEGPPPTYPRLARDLVLPEPPARAKPFHPEQPGMKIRPPRHDFEQAERWDGLS